MNYNSNKSGFGGNSKYSAAELEEAKNATKGLGGLGGLGRMGLNKQGGMNLGGGIGGPIKTDFSSSGNYRKSFKPNFNGIGGSSTSLTKNDGILSNTMNSGRTTLKNNVMQQENYIIEKPTKPQFSSNHPNLLGGYSKPGFSSKYNSNNEFMNPSLNSGRGSYTNSKINKQQFNPGQLDVNTQKNNMNTLLNQQNDPKSKQEYKKNLMMNQENNKKDYYSKPQQSSNHKVEVEEVEDLRPAMNTKR